MLAGCMPDRTKYTILFDQVDHLQVKDPVLNKGVTIGEVTHLAGYGNQVLADIELKDNRNIPKGSTFLAKESLLGSSCIDVNYSDSPVLLTSTDTVRGVFEAKKWEHLSGDTAKRRKIEQSIEKIATGVKELIEAAKDSTRPVNE